MSQEGYDKLVEELRQLESELPVVREAIAEARDKGDLSENFEYHAAKREQSRLLGRIRFKQRVLANARVSPAATKTYMIVSPHEANLHEGKISIKSPIAHALLNKAAGDVVEVHVPAGTMRLRIESIEM